MRGESIGEPRKTEVNGKVVPHLFRATLKENDTSASWFPLEFADAGNGGAMVTAFAEFAENKAFLDEFAQALREEDALDAIGLTLFHGREEISCMDDEVLNESTDEAKRRLIMRPAKRDRIGITTTPTVWRFDGKRVLMSCTCQRTPDGDHGHYESN